jgi:hypothetical protein
MMISFTTCSLPDCLMSQGGAEKGWAGACNFGSSQEAIKCSPQMQLGSASLTHKIGGDGDSPDALTRVTSTRQDYVLRQIPCSEPECIRPASRPE